MCKEYIEREAVCYQLAKQATIDGQPRAIKRAAKIVANFPAADVRPVVRGEWQFHMFTANSWGYECRVCHTTWDTPTNYCPNCGADMREDEKDER